MIDIKKLQPILDAYIKSFPDRWKDEKYKWVAVKHFQEHWDIDAEDFSKMFEEATAKTINLLASGYAYPRQMIRLFSNADPEAVRSMFRDLFDETQDLALRVTAFMEAAEKIRAKYDDGTWHNHYQGTNAISTYLWLKYPEKYYIFKYETIKNTAAELDSDYRPKRNGSVETMLGGYAMYDEICDQIKAHPIIPKMIHDATNFPEFDSDNGLKTTVIDLAFFLSRYYLPKKKNDTDEEKWFPADYDPKLTVEQWATLLEDPEVFTPSALEIVARMKDYGGQATCTQLATKYGESANFYNSGSVALAKRIIKKTGCEVTAREDGTTRYWAVLYLGKDAEKAEAGAFVWRLRDELAKALEKAALPEVRLYVNDSDTPCGYWWLTANPKIWSFSDMAVGEEQDYTLYNDNGNKRRVFQNFLDAKVGDIVLCYETYPIKKIVALAKISQASNGHDIRFTKTEGLSVPLEYNALKDCSELAKMEYFVQPNGSLFRLTKGEYDFIIDLIREENPLKTPDKANPKYTPEDFLAKVFMTKERFEVLRVLLQNKKNVILQGAPGVGKTFTAKKLAYAMMGEEDEERIALVQFHQNYSYEDFVMGYRPDGTGFKLTEGIFYRFCRTAANHPEKTYFFIIDEINRGNLSKVFGELMMLIEKGYRGTTATLAYSGMPFSVPENLYIIGMMNTADRSLAMIDYALRRRFSFFEMEPGFDTEGFRSYQKGLANETFDALIDQVKSLNKAIIEDAALGSGFRIGHSYFCGLQNGEDTDDQLRAIVEFDLLPTLAEYWFDEPEKNRHWEKMLRGVFDDE